MYLNDQIGDCTIATAAHEVEAWTAYSSTEASMSDASVLSAYKAISGYNGNPDTDQGANVVDVLKYWQRTGIGGHKIVAWAALNSLNLTLLKKVLNVFGTVYIGINCPQSAEDQFQDDVPWTYQPGSPIVGGHAIPIQRWDNHIGSIQVVTWGALQRMTLSFAQHYIEEAYVVISQDWITANGDTILGLSLADLIADSHSV